VRFQAFWVLLLIHLWQALKLAERTIQFADTLPLLTEGYLRAGRVSHVSNQLAQAKKFYAEAIENQPKNVIAAIGLAQTQMSTGMMDLLPFLEFSIDIYFR